jgi:hypothetical protein
MLARRALCAALLTGGDARGGGADGESSTIRAVNLPRTPVCRPAERAQCPVTVSETGTATVPLSPVLLAARSPRSVRTRCKRLNRFPAKRRAPPSAYRALSESIVIHRCTAGDGPHCGRNGTPKAVPMSPSLLRR